MLPVAVPYEEKELAKTLHCKWNGRTWLCSDENFEARGRGTQCWPYPAEYDGRKVWPGGWIPTGQQKLFLPGLQSILFSPGQAITMSQP